MQMPKDLGPWSARKLDTDRRFLGSVGFTRHMLRSYTQEDRPGEGVRVFTAYHNRVNRPTSLVSPKVEIPGAGYEVAEQWPVSLGGDLPDACRLHALVTLDWILAVF